MVYNRSIVSTVYNRSIVPTVYNIEVKCFLGVGDGDVVTLITCTIDVCTM
jgi:hypothetical protein